MNKKILIVEDEPSLSGILDKMVRQLGYESHIANDGEVALQLCRSVQPDLIILDLVIPTKSGMEVLQEIRTTDQNKVPVIILSNLDSEADINTGKKLGASYKLKSNLSLDNLTQAIQAAIS